MQNTNSTLGTYFASECVVHIAAHHTIECTQFAIVFSMRWEN